MQGAADKFVSASREVISRLTLSDEECQVLACVGRSARWSEILERCGLAESKALDALLMLRAKGALLQVKRKKRPAPVPSPEASPPVASEPAPEPEIAVDARPSAPAETALDSRDHSDATRAEERRQRLARHPYLARIKRQYRPH